MFSNTVYSSILNNKDGYRKIGSGNNSVIASAFKVYILKFTDYLITNNYVINVIITIIICIFIFQHIIQSNNIAKKDFIISGYSILFSIWSLIKNTTNINLVYLGLRIIILESILATLFLINIAIFIIIYIKDPNDKRELLFYGFSSFILSAPFLILTPVSDRCFLSSIFMYILIIGKLSIILYENKKNEDTSKNKIKTTFLTHVLAFIVSMHFIVYLGISFANNVYHERRLNYIYSQKGESVDVWNLPYPQYTHLSSPAPFTHPQQVTFKDFYNLDPSLTFNYIDIPKN